MRFSCVKIAFQRKSQNYCFEIACVSGNGGEQLVLLAKERKQKRGEWGAVYQLLPPPLGSNIGSAESGQKKIWPTWQQGDPHPPMCFPHGINMQWQQYCKVSVSQHEISESTGVLLIWDIKENSAVSTMRVLYIYSDQDDLKRVVCMVCCRAKKNEQEPP